nr:glycosyl hydrolase family 28-related protein [Bacillota bacterium]
MPSRFKLSVFMFLIICLLICIILFVIYHQVLFQADPVPDSTIMASSVIAISDTSSVKYASHVVPETKNIEIKSTNNTATENDSRIIDIRDVINARNGDTIYLPAGIYFISRALRLKSNTLLMGQGMEETKIIAQKDFHDSPAMIIFEREASNITIKDVCLDGNNDAFDTVSAIFGIRTYISDEYIYTNNSNVTIEGVEIKNTSQHGISLEGKTK